MKTLIIKKLWCVMLVCQFMSLLAACDNKEPVTVRDYRYNPVVFDKTPTRVVVLSSPLVSVLDSLEIKIIGSNTLADEVRGELKYNTDIADIGSAVFPDLEKIKSLNPDVVIMGSAFVKLTDDIKAIGTQLWTVDNQTYSQLLDCIEQFGMAFNKENEATALLAGIENRIDSVMDKIKDKEKPDVLVLWGTSDGLLVAQNKSFACDILTMLGCRNAALDVALVPEIPNFMYQMDEEKISALNPDVIIRIYDSPPDTVKPHFDANDTQLTSGTWSHMNAAKNGKIFTLPQEGFAANPGVTMADSIEKLAALVFELE